MFYKKSLFCYQLTTSYKHYIKFVLQKFTTCLKILGFLIAIYILNKKVHLTLLINFKSMMRN